MNFENLSILVTGGAGFIGSHITDYLLNNNAKFVRILDNLSTGNLNNIQNLINNFDNLEFYYGDITNIDICRKTCAGIDIICHQAALGSVPRSINDPLSSHNSNVNGFLNILVAAKESNIKRIVFASSSSVYGDNHIKIKNEDDIGKQLSPYAITKYIDELYARIFSEIYGLECIGLRYFNVFGPKQNPDGAYAAVIPKFIKSIINGDNVIINGNGNNSRDFTYIDNIVSANCLAMTTVNTKSYGQIFNVGTNNSISINELLNSIKKILNKNKVIPIYGPERAGDVANSNASIKKISEHLNYQPKVYFIDGLERTINYFTSIC